MGIKIENISTAHKKNKEATYENILKKEIILFGRKFSNKKKEQFYSELGVLLNRELI